MRRQAPRPNSCCTMQASSNSLALNNTTVLPTDNTSIVREHNQLWTSRFSAARRLYSIRRRAQQAIRIKYCVNYFVRHQRLPHSSRWQYQDWKFVQLYFWLNCQVGLYVPSTLQYMSSTYGHIHPLS
jgi:hypothetical protein